MKEEFPEAEEDINRLGLVSFAVEKDYFIRPPLCAKKYLDAIERKHHLVRFFDNITNLSCIRYCVSLFFKRLGNVGRKLQTLIFKHDTWSGMMAYIRNIALQGKATVSRDSA